MHSSLSLYVCALSANCVYYTLTISIINIMDEIVAFLANSNLNKNI